jgi:hypothetical protein
MEKPAAILRIATQSFSQAGKRWPARSSLQRAIKIYQLAFLRPGAVLNTRSRYNPSTGVYIIIEKQKTTTSQHIKQEN